MKLEKSQKAHSKANGCPAFNDGVLPELCLSIHKENPGLPDSYFAKCDDRGHKVKLVLLRRYTHAAQCRMATANFDHAMQVRAMRAVQ